MAQKDERPKETPTDDVKQDPEALKEAEERMHAGGSGGDFDEDPPGGHDPEALEEGAKRMGVKR